MVEAHPNGIQGVIKDDRSPNQQLLLGGGELFIGEETLCPEGAETLKLGGQIFLWGRCIFHRWGILLLRWGWGLLCRSRVHSLGVSLCVLIRLTAVYSITCGSGCADYGSSPCHSSH
jgi:hypothetical protein